MTDRIPHHSSGLGYIYSDEYIHFSESKYDINGRTHNPLYYSLEPMFKSSRDCGFVLINDQPPERSDAPSSYAHMKGVLIFDNESGIYVEHSVPRFPPMPSNNRTYEYPSSGRNYGQTILCTSFHIDMVEIISKGLLIEKPFVYDYYIPWNNTDKVPSLIKVINQEWNTIDDSFISNISVGQHNFKFFAKSPRWGKDLYSELIAPSLKSSVYAETWSLGVGTMNSTCKGPYETHNILELSFIDMPWKRTKDHSKWCIAGNNICIGGINRQFSQTNRGGGCWCLSNEALTDSFRQGIISIQECPEYEEL